MQGIIGITGTPGTGKKSVAPLVAKGLGLRAYSLNALASELGLTTKVRGELEVDTKALRQGIRGRGPSVVYGHLLPYAVDRGSLSRVAVLRCEPGVLKLRLSERRYPAKKLEENVEAELIGVVSADTFDAFGDGKAFEVDATAVPPASIAKTIVDTVQGGLKPPRRIDWTRSYDSAVKLRSLLSIDGP